MNIHEHQAKKILKEYGAPVSNGVVIYDSSEVKNKIKLLKSKQFVLKAQIHAGGRGKAGGVKLIDSLGIDGDFVESQAFGYLAIRSYLKLPISFPETTGCNKASTGGVIVKNY